MDSNLKILLRKYIVSLCISFITSLTVVGLIVEFIFGYILKVKIFEGSGFQGLLVIIFISFIFSFILGFFKLIEYCKEYKILLIEKMKEDNHNDFLNSLVCEIEESFNKNNWEEVIKVGSVLSRPLWTTGRYKLRITVGKLVEQAAAYLVHPKEQAQALIDDLGWTNFELNNVEEALKNIEHGIIISEQNNLYELAYKGYRHLSGIYLSKNEIDNAEFKLEKSFEFSKKIINENERKLSEAGYLVNKAIILQNKNELQDAILLMDKAQEMYKELEDKDREVKLYHFKGDLLLKAKDLKGAKDIYRKGLAESIKQSRRDGIFRNTFGIALVAEEEGELSEAMKMFNESLNIAEDLGFNDKVQICKNKIENITKKITK